MIIHYFKLAQKALRKSAYYTLINIFGLVCGTLTALIIANHIGSTLQQDKFHEHKELIYSVTQEETINSQAQKLGKTVYYGLGEKLKQYPEVKMVTRTSFHVASLVKVEGQEAAHVENEISIVDSNFLKVFTFPLILGDLNTALSQTNAMVISKGASKKYFGDSNPLGQAMMIRLPWGPEQIYKVTGVLDDGPDNTQFKFEFLLTPASSLEAANYWDYPNFSTFALLDAQAADQPLIGKVNAALKEEPALKAAEKQVEVALQPIASAQLSDTQYLLIMVGIFILLTSWVNYFNQVIAQSYARSKQIGVLKVLGASSQHLKMQFALEAALIGFASIALTIGIYLLMEPTLQSFTNGKLLASTAIPTRTILLFSGIFTLGIGLAAVLPILIFSTQNFGATLRDIQWNKVGKLGLRKTLVIVQFTLSTVMIIGVFVISNQLNYLESQDKGMNMEDVLVVKAPILKPGNWFEKRKALELFKEKCSRLPFVLEATSSTTVASEEYRNETYIGFQNTKDKVLVHQNGIDEYFFDLYDVEFIAGNNFIADARFKNRKSIILNETAARNLGVNDFNEIISTQIVDEESDEAFELVGIVKDFHKTSLKYQMAPTAFKYNDTRGHFSLKIADAGGQPNQLEQQVSAIQEIWEQVYRGTAFNYFFLDQRYAEQDAEDRNFGILFKYFTILSIVISCLGLFSLSLFISIKRQKEIGVRKVFGASVADILLTFYKSYISPLLVSIIIGAPLAYFLMNKWLQNYAYRIEIGFATIGLALLSLCLVFLLTISYHIIKSSLTEPVNVLKGE